MSMRRATIVALFGLLTLVGLGSSASAQPYPPSEDEGTVNRSTVEAGGSVIFCGDGFAPGSTVTILVDEEVEGTRTADAEGEFCTTITLDEPGTYELSGVGVDADGGARVVTATVTVVAAGGLPRTGSDSTLPAIGIGLGLVTAGTGLVYAVRRQRSRGPATA